MISSYIFNFCWWISIPDFTFDYRVENDEFQIFIIFLIFYQISNITWTVLREMSIFWLFNILSIRFWYKLLVIWYIAHTLQRWPWCILFFTFFPIFTPIMLHNELNGNYIIRHTAQHNHKGQNNLLEKIHSMPVWDFFLYI